MRLPRGRQEVRESAWFPASEVQSQGKRRRAPLFQPQVARVSPAPGEILRLWLRSGCFTRGFSGINSGLALKTRFHVDTI